MSHQARFLGLAFCLSAFASTAVAQSPAASPAPPARKSASGRTAAAADPLAEVRRQTAVTLLNSLADEARNFSDLASRARVQARSADALWETNKTRALELFRRAWEAARAADEETGKLVREAERSNSRQRAAELRNRPNLRREVLRLAARRDRALGEEFLAQLDESKKQEDAGNTTPSAAQQTPRINPDNPPPSMLQRLTLARQLLEDGDTDRAVQFADPALYPVNTFGINFLEMLREKNRQAADERYMALVMRAAADPVADANTVSLLSSYVFTPYIYITFNREGDSHTRRWRENNTPPADLSPALREAFFNTAAAILLRPLPPPEEDQSTTARAGTYMVINRLTQLFEQYAPQHVAALRARLAILQPDTRENLRQGDRTATFGLVPESRDAHDPSQEIALALDRAKTSTERDEVYFRAAMGFSESDVARAREYADKIENPDFRRQVRAAVDFRAVQNALRNKNAEEALRLARGSEITPLQRVYSITSAARLLATENPGRAVEMLEEAITESRRIDAASPDRVRALVAIVTPLISLDRARAWEMMSEVVKASNASTQFTGEDGYLMVRVQLSGGGAMTMNFPVEDFDLTGIFTTLAKEDFNRAVELAKSFTGESPRAVATLAVARAALEKKK